MLSTLSWKFSWWSQLEQQPATSAWFNFATWWFTFQPQQQHWGEAVIDSNCNMVTSPPFDNVGQTDVPTQYQPSHKWEHVNQTEWAGDLGTCERNQHGPDCSHTPAGVLTMFSSFHLSEFQNIWFRPFWTLWRLFVFSFPVDSSDEWVSVTRRWSPAVTSRFHMFSCVPGWNDWLFEFLTAWTSLTILLRHQWRIFPLRPSRCSPSERRE